MKKMIYSLLVVAAIAMSCEDSTENLLTQEEISSIQEIDMSDFYARTDDVDLSTSKGKLQHCFTMQELNRQLDANPGLYNKMYNIEKNMRKFIASKKPAGAGNGNGNGNGGNDGGDGGTDPVDDGLGTITIPVNVHVIYNTSADNISLSQIQSQIAVLNDDFAATNGDFSNNTNTFEGDKGVANVQFVLDQVTRTHNSKNSWPINNTMKYASSGGHNVDSPDTHLNIWVVNVFDGNQTLGFAYLPGTAPSGADGVVIASPYFGDEGTAGSIYPEFGFGRTTTHEVGHWLNLRHIWGDGRCKKDDMVSDTPSSDDPNFGSPGPLTVITNCRSRDMHMNYMDYVDDESMFMFSNGQVDRMRANFAAGGERFDMAN